MKFQELTELEKNNIKKHIKEELRPSGLNKQLINPNSFEYKHSKGGLQLSGRLVGMNDSQIKSTVIRNVKDKLKKAA